MFWQMLGIVGAVMYVVFGIILASSATRAKTIRKMIIPGAVAIACFGIGIFAIALAFSS